MPEALSASEVGKEIAEHRKHQAERHARRDRLISIVEAILLSVVALIAAWSGYSAAKWSTESRVGLAKASALRSQANRANLNALEVRNFDSSTFAAWFAAYTATNAQAMAVAERRFRPAFRVAFDAWRATNPDTNPNAPRGPTYMPQYRQPELVHARRLDRRADEAFAEGASAGVNGDKYVRTTVFLATVLFLVGISGHFRVRAARYGLIGLSVCILVLALFMLISSPLPPA